MYLLDSLCKAGQASETVQSIVQIVLTYLSRSNTANSMSSLIPFTSKQTNKQKDSILEKPVYSGFIVFLVFFSEAQHDFC